MNQYLDGLHEQWRKRAREDRAYWVVYCCPEHVHGEICDGFAPADLTHESILAHHGLTLADVNDYRSISRLTTHEAGARIETNHRKG